MSEKSIKNPKVHADVHNPKDILEQTMESLSGYEDETSLEFAAEKKITGTSHLFTEEYRPRVLITGGGSGIGRTTAFIFAEEGYDVAITHHDDEDTAREIQTYIQENFGAKCAIINVDLEDVEQVDRMVEEAIEKLGGIDVLINNAGISNVAKPFEDSMKSMDDTYRINFRAPIYALTKLAEYWRDNKIPGSCINISSIHANDVNKTYAIYGALKAGLERATETYAYQYGEYGIRVNAVAPGAILIDRTGDGHSVENMVEDVPLSRSGLPRDIAHTALFLASERASYITGISILVDGGKQFTMT